MNDAELDGFEKLAEQAQIALAAIGAPVPDYTASRLQVKTRTCARAEEAWQAVLDFAPSTGWLMHASAVRLWNDGAADHRDSDGPLLAAELVRDGASLHVRYGRSGWTLVTLSEGVGDRVIAHRESFAAIRPAAGQPLLKQSLLYCVYHRRHEELGLRPFQARFLGFGDE